VQDMKWKALLFSLYCIRARKKFALPEKFCGVFMGKVYYEATVLHTKPYSSRWQRIYQTPVMIFMALMFGFDLVLVTQSFHIRTPPAMHYSSPPNHLIITA